MNSVEFLRFMHPEGPWVLTAIAVSGKGIETITFQPNEEEKLTKWLNKRNGKQNLYFSVNRPYRPLANKASRNDIGTVAFFHVDIDARVGEPLNEELDRINVLLLRDCPVATPSVVIASGGGYQAFWRLREPIDVKGNAEAATLAERYNRQLEIVLGGDHCHNIDRIMRLPGTMNLPNAKKTARGRIPVQATVERYGREDYPLTSFTPAPDIQMTESRGTTVIVPVEVPRVNNVDDLPVDDRVKVIIVQGHHPDEVKAGDNSRSAWLFDAICQMVRADMPDELIFSVITDPDFKISDSVLDKRPNETEYAARQIQRAREEVENPWLRKLNETFMIIGSINGKCRVVEEVHDPLTNRNIFTKQTFTDFRNRFAHINITDGRKASTVANWWLAHPRRRQYETITFSPGRTTNDSYNLWQGFACPAMPGDKHEPYLSHVLNNVCCGDLTHYRYLLGWLARCVQKPDRPGETAVVLRGASGVGKSFFAREFGAIFGRHFFRVSDARHLVGNFNAHLRDCVVLFGDEAFFAGDRRHESVLKTLITEDWRVLESKGIDAEIVPNFTHLIMASNADWVVPTGPTERRFFVLDVSAARRRDARYFGAITEAMNNGGRENLLHYLLNYELSSFNVRVVPATRALHDQKLLSLDPFEWWWYRRLCDGALLAGQDEYHSQVLCEDLFTDYVTEARRFNVQRMGNPVWLGRFLGKVCPEDWPKRERSMIGPSRPYVYTFPPLNDLRKHWEQLYDTTVAWHNEKVTGQLRAPF